MHFLQVNIMFCDAVTMIHDVITTANPFPYTAKFMPVSVRINKSVVERYIEYIHSIVMYQKYLTQFGEMLIFSPRLENYQFPQLR